jgi:hypothetical protein
MRQMQKNDEFLKGVFKVPASILPLQNLGEIAFIMNQPNAAFCLLDMCTKLYKHIDSTNLAKFKALTLLGSLLDRAGSTNEMQMIHKSIFKALEDVNCFERVFATRNYGYLLAGKDATRLEG